MTFCHYQSQIMNPYFGEMKTAALLIIGDEILSGTTQDTNSFFITEQLSRIGIQTIRILVVSDTPESIQSGLDQLYNTETDIVLSTGGLGPTRDDRTKKTLSEYFNRPLYHNENVWRHLSDYLASKNRSDILELNREQAQVMQGARIFQNDYGTAPCQMIEENGRYFFCLPGVPYETKGLMKDKIIPFLTQKSRANQIIVRTATVSHIPESILSEKLTEWEQNLPQHIKLSYLPVSGRINLKFTAYGKDKAQLENDLEEVISPLSDLLGKHLISTRDEKIEVILSKILLERGLSISTVESCTLGNVALLIGSVPGASAYLAGGIITYHTEQKVNLAGVPKELIDQHTVVSQEVAVAMAKGGRKRMKTDLCIATTGVAGPSKGEDGKEIGSVWIAIDESERSFSTCYYYPFLERKDFITFVANKALEELINFLNQNEKNNL